MAQDIDREGVRRLMERGAQIVDVLPAREYAEDHRPGPSTYRPFVSVAEMRRIMIDRNLESSPVTTSDGRLVGLVRKQDVGIR
jgi:predicted transcriptional regulator